MPAAPAWKLYFLAAYALAGTAVFLVLQGSEVWGGPAADDSFQDAGANAAAVTTLRGGVLDLQEQFKVEQQGRRLSFHGHGHAGEAEAETPEPEHHVVTDIKTDSHAKAETKTLEGVHDHADNGHEEAADDHAGLGHEKAADDHAFHGHGEAAHDQAGHGHEEAAHDHPGPGHEEKEGHGKEAEHDAGHGGHSGHGEGHHLMKVDGVTLAISYMLFGFLSTNMVLLYLVNYPDENIRSATFQMLSMTISIFCAVLLNQAIFGFLYEQVLASPFPHGLGFGHPISFRLKIIVGFCMTFTWWALLNVSMHSAKDDHIKCYAYKSILGHLTAFAAIEACGNMQQAYNEIKLTAIIAAASPLVYCLFAWASMGIRVRILFGSRSGHHVHAGDCTHICDGQGSYLSVQETARSMPGAHEEGAEVEGHGMEWMEELIDAEDEAGALCISFIIMQVFVQLVLGHIAPIHGDHEIHSVNHVASMGKWSLGVLGAVIFISMMRAHGLLYCIKVQKIDDETRPLARLSTFQHLTVTLLLCWCSWRTASWGAKYYFSHAASKVITAGALTIWCVILLIILDCFADALRKKQAEFGPRVSLQPWTGLETPADQGGKEYTIISPLTIIEGLCKRGVSEDFHHNERTIRSLMASLGFLVGIVWEKAIAAAEEVIVASDISKKHPVIALMVMAVIICLIVLPGWMKYIVPKATMSEEQHRSMIEEYKATKREIKTQKGGAK